MNFPQETFGLLWDCLWHFLQGSAGSRHYRSFPLTYSIPRRLLFGLTTSNLPRSCCVTSTVLLSMATQKRARILSKFPTCKLVTCKLLQHPTPNYCYSWWVLWQDKCFAWNEWLRCYTLLHNVAALQLFLFLSMPEQKLDKASSTALIN